MISVKNRKKNASATATDQSGKNPIRLPKVTAIAFPPLNLEKIGRICPITGDTITIGKNSIEGLSVLRYRKTGKKPFAMSKSKVNAPQKKPP